MTEVIKEAIPKEPDRDHCEICGTSAGYLGPCYFCHRTICSKDAHHMTIQEHHVSGLTNHSIRICASCKPRMSYPW